MHSANLVSTLANRKRNPEILTMAKQKNSRKLPMEKRQNPKQRAVTFTKRRQGLFNKAAELSAICGAQIALLVTSPCAKRKIFSFSTHKSIHTILDAYLKNQVPAPLDDATKAAALSLWHEVKKPETTCYPSNIINDVQERPTWDLSEFENSGKITVLQALLKLYENKQKMLSSRINSNNNSDSTPFYFGSTSAAIPADITRPSTSGFGYDGIDGLTKPCKGNNDSLSISQYADAIAPQYASFEQFVGTGGFPNHELSISQYDAVKTTYINADANGHQYASIDQAVGSGGLSNNNLSVADYFCGGGFSYQELLNAEFKVNEDNCGTLAAPILADFGFDNVQDDYKRLNGLVDFGFNTLQYDYSRLNAWDSQVYSRNTEFQNNLGPRAFNAKDTIGSLQFDNFQTLPSITNEFPDLPFGDEWLNLLS